MWPTGRYEQVRPVAKSGAGAVRCSRETVCGAAPAFSVAVRAEFRRVAVISNTFCFTHTFPYTNIISYAITNSSDAKSNSYPSCHHRYKTHVFTGLINNRHIAFTNVFQ